MMSFSFISYGYICSQTCLGLAFVSDCSCIRTRHKLDTFNTTNKTYKNFIDKFFHLGLNIVHIYPFFFQGNHPIFKQVKGISTEPNYELTEEDFIKEEYFETEIKDYHFIIYERDKCCVFCGMYDCLFARHPKPQALTDDDESYNLNYGLLMSIECH